MLDRMKYYCIKQHDITDCGAACLATISKQNGYKIGITKIREVAGTDKRGTNAYGVIKAAEQLGFRAKGVIFLNLFKVLLDAFRSHLLLYLSQKLDIALLLGYYQHVLELPMNFFGTRKVGEIVSRFNDAGKVRDAISGATLTIMIDTLMAVAGAVILYIQNGKMFGITLIMVALYAVIVAAFHKWYEKLNREQMEDNAQLTSYLVESLNGIQTVKAYNAERKANRETEKKFIKLLKSIFRLSWVGNVQSSLKVFVELVGGVVILWVGAVSVIHGEMTMGALITFQSLLAYFLDPVKNLIS